MHGPFKNESTLFRGLRRTDRLPELSTAVIKPRLCSVAGCTKPAPVGHGPMCTAHRSRKIRGWSIQRLVEQPLRVVGTIMRDCEVEGCDRLHMARGYCVGHYHRWKNGATDHQMAIPLYGMQKGRPIPTSCTVTGCPSRPRSHGLCSAHYESVRLRRKGMKCAARDCQNTIKRLSAEFCSRKCAYQDAFARQRAAYEFREQGDAWSDIAERLSLADGATALQCARRHAKRNNQQWPLNR